MYRVCQQHGREREGGRKRHTEGSHIGFYIKEDNIEKQRLLK
jgi:hypothetical protein